MNYSFNEFECKICVMGVNFLSHIYNLGTKENLDSLTSIKNSWESHHSCTSDKNTDEYLHFA